MCKKILAAFLTVVPLVLLAAEPQPDASLSVAVDQLLKAYSSKNADQFLALTDPAELLILGTDVSELADSPAEARALLEADFKLWGSAEFGERTFTSIRESDQLAAVAFDVPFSMRRDAKTTDTMTIRFLTVWKRSSGKWLLTQSLNSVPTTGQSARDLTNKHP